VFRSESLTRMFRSVRSASRGPGRPFCFLGTTILILLLVSLGWPQGNEWKWLTGGNLNKVKFIGQKGWIIGDDGNQGIILHTTNGGDTWAIQPHNTGRHYFRGLSFCDSLNGVIVGGYRSMGEPGFIMKTSDGGQTWSLGTSPTTYNLNRVCYLDTLHIWMTSDTSAIFRTTDGGNIWDSAPVDRGYQGMDFLDSLRGFAVSDPGIFEIAKTTDGGRTWNYTLDNTVAGTSSINMADSMRGGSAGSPNVMVITTNGWQTWTQVPCGGGGALNDISYHDTLNGFMVGGQNNHPAQYYRTTDGGLTWAVDSITQNRSFAGVDAKQLPVAWIAGEAGSILKTTTSGNTWTVLRNVDIGTTSLINADFYDANQGWAVGTYGVITHTTNGGTVWQFQTSNVSSDLLGISFADSVYGKICTYGGGILGTRDGGNLWAGESTGATHPLWSIDLVDTAFGVAVGGEYGPPLDSIRRYRAEGLRSRGAEERWGSHTNDDIASSSRSREFLRFAQDKPRNDTPWIDDTLKLWGTGLDFCKYPWRLEETVLTTAYRTITRTTNGGALWIAQNTSGQVPLFGVSFVSRSEGWACGDIQGGMGVILHTTDSGATWQGQSSNVSQFLNWIQFRGTQNGWCVGGGGTALWTTDGGNTWNQGNSGTAETLWSCAFYDSIHGFACGNNGLLIKTVDGGRNWTPDTSMVYANLTAVNALDSLHAWTVGSYGMVLGWREAGVEGVETATEGSWQLAVGRLEQSYPNPMRENCAIGYWLLANSKAELSIYDITGRRVRSFPRNEFGVRMTDIGRHTVIWDGRDETGKNVPAGVYFYQLRAKEITETKKLVKIQ